MGKDNKCKAVYNNGIAGKKRIACSVCGSIWDDGIPGHCPVCKRRVKKSCVSAEVA